ncbi:uncharacterized protein LOC127877982 [Dreissena polymorpha]|uniref:Uncharacterized protein n=1 Tax=Dreissena polymorpha TaxID=45954 RepID=A0A9D4KKG6_DREPO|nr:uncharacterized protein LOC127877982 [Dreissena polymorpha]KAH3841188.1 hypothetical protein DPMN_114645 [Dreissena polymorpha]
MTNVFGTASTWAKLALVLIVVAAALHVAGFATSYWMLTETIQENLAFATGLWKAINCSGGHDSACADIDVPSEHKTGSFKAVQAFESIVLVLVVVGAIIAAMYVASERFREISIAITITILCFVAVTLGIISMIIWLVFVASDYYPGYSIGLCVTAFLMCFLAGVLMIPDIRRYQGNSGKIRRVRPEERTEANTYDKFRDHKRSDYSFNRKFASPPPETPVTNIRHYYNPNREPYVRSPPPSYQTARASVNSRSVRTDIQTPDVYLGRDGRKHTRY